MHYQVQFAPTGNKALDKTLKETSDLVTLQKKLRPAPFALIGRAKADETEFKTVLHSMGYDTGQVNITIDGMALDNPDLLPALTATPESKTVTVHVTVKKGPLYHVGQVKLAGAPPGFTPPPMVKTGQVAEAAPILAAAPKIQTALENDGYAYAKVQPPMAVANRRTDALNVTYKIKPGPRVDIGPITFSGLKRTDPAFLRRHIALHRGEQFSTKALASARNSLLGLGLFSSVNVAPQPEQDGTAPILFHVIPQKLHAVTLSGAYATDTGVSASVSWEDRNLFRHAETLTLTATADGLGGTGTTSPGYDLKAAFAKPDYYVRGQVLTLSVEGLKQSLTAYDRTGILLGAHLSRPITAHTTLTYGPTFTSERVTQEGRHNTYVLVQFPIDFTYSTVNNLLEPTHGINAGITLTPSAAMVGSSQEFLLVNGQASTYLPVERAARGVIAVRIMVGSELGATPSQLPPDQRFYAGGSGTVRGYNYQTIGPRFADEKPRGGGAMDAINLEFRQHVWGKFGVVPFVDAGQVSTSSAPFSGRLRVGVGLGVRYYTGIGPIRVDVAFPMTRTPGSNAFSLYVGLGEAF